MVGTFATLKQDNGPGADGRAHHQPKFNESYTNKMKEETNEQRTTPAKEVLTAREAAAYMDISLSYLYRLTMDRAIPFYKPNGKRIYFKRGEVEDWLTSIKCYTDTELQAQAEAYTKGKGGAR